MSRAIYNLVRVDTVEDSESLDYSPGSVQQDQCAEILLTDFDGEPCANPQVVDGNNYDIEHDFGNGNLTRTPVAQTVNLSVRCDFLDSDKYLQLEKWKRDRALVRFAPGYGFNTELAWRPLEGTTSISDLTGQHTLTIAGDSTRDAFWQDFAGPSVMRSGFTGGQRIVPTPGGAGQVFERSQENLASPDSPVSGSLGWAAGGTGSASLSLAYVADAFGHSDCPHAVRVVGSATTDDRYVFLSIPAMNTAGTGTANGACWIKGRLPSEAKFYIGKAADRTATDLTGGDYSDWTRIDTQHVGAFASTGYYILIDLQESGESETCDFLIGPSVVVHTAKTSQYAEPYPTWQAEGAAKNSEYLATSVDMRLPSSGSIFSSFYIPEWYAEQDSQLIGLSAPDYTGDAAGQMFLISYNANTATRLVFDYQNGGSLTAVVSPNPGEINTASVTYGAHGVVLYFNGEAVATGSTAAYKNIFFPDEPYFIGRSDYYGANAWPFVMLSHRVERDVWSAARMAQEHKTLTDPRSIATLVKTRGRAYYIESLPDTQRQVSGYSYWQGSIGLRQASYDSTTADLMSKEPF